MVSLKPRTFPKFPALVNSISHVSRDLSSSSYSSTSLIQVELLLFVLPLSVSSSEMRAFTALRFIPLLITSAVARPYDDDDGFDLYARDFARTDKALHAEDKSQTGNLHAREAYAEAFIDQEGLYAREDSHAGHLHARNADGNDDPFRNY